MSKPKEPARRYSIDKSQWRVHAIATCADCGAHWESLNGQGLAAQHAMKTGHTVRGEIGLAFEYKPKK